VSSLFEMEVGIEESNYEYELWIWKVKVVYIMLLLWKVKLSLRKCEVARRRRPEKKNFEFGAPFSGKKYNFCFSS
jgi:hypothetical protein